MNAFNDFCYRFPVLGAALIGVSTGSFVGFLVALETRGWLFGLGCGASAMVMLAARFYPQLRAVHRERGRAGEIDGGPAPPPGADRTQARGAYRRYVATTAAVAGAVAILTVGLRGAAGGDGSPVWLVAGVVAVLGAVVLAVRRLFARKG